MYHLYLSINNSRTEFTKDSAFYKDGFLQNVLLTAEYSTGSSRCCECKQSVTYPSFYSILVVSGKRQSVILAFIKYYIKYKDILNTFVLFFNDIE